MGMADLPVGRGGVPLRPEAQELLIATAVVAVAGLVFAYAAAAVVSRRDDRPGRSRALRWCGNLLLATAVICGSTVAAARDAEDKTPARKNDTPIAGNHFGDMKQTLYGYLEAVDARNAEEIRNWMCTADHGRDHLDSDPPFAAHLPGVTVDKGRPDLLDVAIRGTEARIVYTTAYRGDLGSVTPTRLAYLRLEGERWTICTESAVAFEEAR